MLRWICQRGRFGSTLFSQILSLASNKFNSHRDSPFLPGSLKMSKKRSAHSRVRTACDCRDSRREPRGAGAGVSRACLSTWLIWSGDWIIKPRALNACSERKVRVSPLIDDPHQRSICIGKVGMATGIPTTWARESVPVAMGVRSNPIQT
jgi:hypothetical protein